MADPEAVVLRAQEYFDQGDFANARAWFARRAEMGGQDEEAYLARYREAESMAHLGAPWPEVQNAYLNAWELRPTRAEPLYAIAHQYRVDRRFRLGHLFAKRAAGIAFPEADRLSVRADIYGWRAADEQAVCASWLGAGAEAFTLWRRVLARTDVAEEDRQRIAGNRDLCVPAMIEAALGYPEALVGSLRRRVVGPGSAEVVVSLIAGADRVTTERTLNSFLHCCLDVLRVGRFLVVDVGLSAPDRALLLERYGFLEFVDVDPNRPPGDQLAQIGNRIEGRFWLHLGQGWRFFAPENLITRMTAVLVAEDRVLQVGVNFADAGKLTGAVASEAAARHAPDTGRYVLTDAVARGPAMFDIARLDTAGGLRGLAPDPVAELGQRAGALQLRTASLDEVLCVPGLDVYRESPWTSGVAEIINELLSATGGQRFAELSSDGVSPYFTAVLAQSKVSLPYRPSTDSGLDEDFLAVDPAESGYDVIFIDTADGFSPSLELIEACLPALSTGGALVLHGSNPLTEGQQRRAVLQFRLRHPQCEVFTVDTGWGCTVIRPGRRARPALDSNRPLNLVDVAWFRRHLYAEPYLAGAATLVNRTEVLNFLISIGALDTYLEIGIADGGNLARVIAPIQHAVDPHPELGGAAAMYPMTSDEFFSRGLGLDRYDVIFIDGLHTEEQCRRDLENALDRISDGGWIVAHDANPPTEWHQRPVEQFEQGSAWNGTVWKALVRFRSAHPECELYTLDLDWGCALVRRRAAQTPPQPVPELPDTLDWAFFAEHRRDLLTLVPASADQLRHLLETSSSC